jgi:mono/diheme cytochrome c family protein
MVTILRRRAAWLALVLLCGAGAAACQDAPRPEVPPPLVPPFPEPIHRVGGSEAPGVGGPRRADAGEAIRARVAAADPARGGTLYAEHCSRCHGAEGHGDGPEVATSGRTPRSFARLRRADLDPARLVQVVSAGDRAGMPAFGPKLGEDGVTDVVAYLERLIRPTE